MRPPILVFAINPGLQLAPQTLPTSIEGVAYEATLTAIRGQPPYEFTISPPDALDDLGLTFTDNGDGTATIAGATPTAGTASFTVTLADDAEAQVFRVYGLQVAAIPQPPDPVVVTGTAPDGDVGDAYSYTFSATGGDGGPYTWSVVSGALPGGVTLNSSNGEISGTLTTDGTFNFTIRATDGDGATGDSDPQSVVVDLVLTYATLNPSDKAASITLSNGNLTAQGTVSAAALVRATIGRSTGKEYFEVTYNTSPPNNQNNQIGIVVGGTSTAQVPANGTTGVAGSGFGMTRNPQLNYQNGGGVATQTLTGLGLFVAGDVAMIAIDHTNHLLWVGRNGTWANSGNPAAGTNPSNPGGVPITSATIYAGLGLGNNGVQMTANFGASAFAYTVPTGFRAGVYSP